MGKRRRAREYALKMLYASDVGQFKEADECLSQFWTLSNNCPDDIKQYAETLMRGALGHLQAIDAIISEYIKNWTLERIAPIDRNILRLGIYELLYEALDEKIIIDEAVEIAKKYASADSFQFINAILDAVNKKYRCTVVEEKVIDGGCKA
ncbi:MAG: transcription antitermination factor NusB [Candidatus Fischerbacteria bacterium RBG_13_37_8]|uniref:Transcription antitermination protein NusB n=1 Tax=Candidatus Fischerbacteria bacterium RBG_13_37_8 TaxID=1817863 RepID=A0A1F5VDE5_9BACT|nr:MAG: transcription antitermination factor NusB [Candidatus Fischerbacteria bacterium RBG_13_37_8]